MNCRRIIAYTRSLFNTDGKRNEVYQMQNITEECGHTCLKEIDPPFIAAEFIYGTFVKCALKEIFAQLLVTQCGT